MKLREAVAYIETVLPMDLIEAWDNCGLLIGDPEAEVTHIRTALEASEEVVAKAVEDGVDLLVVHHPMIFQPMKSVTTETLRGRKVIKMIQNNIALYAAHTNLDRAEGGMNQRFGQMLGFKELEHYGEDGYILIGELASRVSLSGYVQQLREILKTDSIRYVGKADRQIRRVAFCTGSGTGMLDDGLFEAADVYITGDLTYHTAMDHYELDRALIDAGHFGTEAIAGQVLFDLLTGVIDGPKLTVDRSIVNPITVI